MTVYAVDTETTRFREPAFALGRKTRVEPFGGHRLVLGSVAWVDDEGRPQWKVLMADELVDFVFMLLAHGDEVVYHNAAFDIHTLCDYEPLLKKEFARAGEEGRLHDTLILEKLIRIARGSATEDLTSGLTLADLAKKYAGMNLDKDERRVTFDQFEGRRIEDVPGNYIEYAREDAEATLQVYLAQRAKAELYADPPNCRYPTLPDARARFGVLAESVNVQGAIALAWLEQFPVRVDQEAARDLCERLETEEARLREALVEFGFARFTPKSKKFSVQQKRLRGILEEWAREQDIVPEYTDSGQISLNGDFWSQHVPAPSAHLLEFPTSAETMTEKLSVWQRFNRVRKLLTTFVYVYAASPVHYPRYNNIGARSTRTSCTRPNVQQTPKRRDGVRGLFVPQSGYTFIESDWVAAELTALAQVQTLMFGSSALGDAINAGEDAHVQTAAAVFGDEWTGADEKRRKELRQAAKAVNFGLPGGMGAAKFSKFARGYGVTLDIDEARDLRNAALEADEELRLYLTDRASVVDRLRQAARNLNMPLERLIDLLDAWRDRDEGTFHEGAALRRLFRWSRGLDRRRYRIPTPPGFRPEWDLWVEDTRTLCGAVRGRAIYTAAHNGPFQGSIAEAAKLMLFRLWSQWAPDCGWNPVAFVHDSVLVEAKQGREEAVAELVEEAMYYGIRTVCPDISGGVETKILGNRWGVSTNALGQKMEVA